MTSNQSFRTQILKVGFSGIGGQIVTFVALPLLSRLYSPEAFGGWALFMSAAMLIGTVATMRYELAVVLPARDTHAAAIIAGASMIVILFALATVVALPVLANFLVGPEVGVGAIWMLPLFVLAIASYQLGLAWCTRRAAFTAYSLGQFTLPAATALAQVIANLFGWSNANGLILGSTIGFAAGASILWNAALQKDSMILGSGFIFRRIVVVLRRYYKYPAFMTPYSFLSVARDRAIYFLLGTHVGEASAGHYAIAQRFTNIPNSLVSGAIRPVFFEHAARRELSSVAPLVYAIMTILTVLAVPNLVVFLYYAGPILGFLFGENWAAAAPYAALLAIPAVPLLLGNWMDRVLDVSNRQGLAFWLETVFAIVTVSTMLIGFVVFNDALVAVGLQAAAMFVYFSLWIVIVFRVAGFPASYPVRIALLGFGLAGISAILIQVLVQFLPLVMALVGFYVIFICFLGFFLLRYRQALLTAIK